jgi:hypothetical protein
MIDVTAKNVEEVAKKLAAGEIPAPAKSLAEAMHRVMTHVGYIQKKGTVAVGKGYKFAGEAQFIEAIRPELVAQQIVVCPIGMKAIVNEVFPSSNGTPQNRIVLRVTFRFTHAPSGEFLDVQTCGEGIDNGDKATNKAMTGAMKYALRQSFVIETGNDPDETPSQQQERAAPARAEPAKPAAQSDEAALSYWSERAGKAKDREALAKEWRVYEADVAAGKVPGTARPAIVAVFKEAGKRVAPQTAKA